MKPSNELLDYARERAEETRQVYVVTASGCVFRLAGNRELIAECGGAVATVRPGRR